MDADAVEAVPLRDQLAAQLVLQLEAQLLERDVSIELTGPATELLADLGYDEAMGARPLARVIQEHIKKPLAEMVLFGSLAQAGGTDASKVNDALELARKLISEKLG